MKNGEYYSEEDGKTLNTYTLEVTGNGDMKDYVNFLIYGNIAPWNNELKDYTDYTTAIAVGSGITRIGNYAFNGYAKITSISISEGVKIIGEYAISSLNLSSSGGHPIDEVVLPASVQTIESNAFYGSSIKTLRFAGGSQLENAESQAFSAIGYLHSVIFTCTNKPKFDDNAFDGCGINAIYPSSWGTMSGNFGGYCIAWIKDGKPDAVSLKLDAAPVSTALAANSYKFYSFTPTETGVYNFCVTSTVVDGSCHVYMYGNNDFTHYLDLSNLVQNNTVPYSLEAGKTYYFKFVNTNANNTNQSSDLTIAVKKRVTISAQLGEEKVVLAASEVGNIDNFTFNFAQLKDIFPDADLCTVVWKNNGDTVEYGHEFTNVQSNITLVASAGVNHDFVVPGEENRWVWNADNTQAYLRLVCSHNSTHVDSIKATMTPVYNHPELKWIEPTNTTDGLHVYELSATYQGNEYTSDDRVAVAIHHHVFSVGESGECTICQKYIGSQGNVDAIGMGGALISNAIHWQYVKNGEYYSEEQGKTRNTYTLEVTGYGDMKDYDVAPWKGRGCITRTIVIGEGITRIGNNAFCSFSSVNSISIPEGVKSIGVDAFGNVGGTDGTGKNTSSNVLEIILPASVKTIENLVFSESNIEKIRFAEGSALESVGYGAFSSSNSSITFSCANQPKFDDKAFDGCNLNAIYPSSWGTMSGNYGGKCIAWLKNGKPSETTSLELNAAPVSTALAANSYKFYSFTPTETGVYYLCVTSSISNGDCWIFMYGNNDFTYYQNKTSLYKNNTVPYSLEAGKTYYFKFVNPNVGNTNQSSDLTIAVKNQKRVSVIAQIGDRKCILAESDNDVIDSFVFSADAIKAFGVNPCGFVWTCNGDTVEYGHEFTNIQSNITLVASAGDNHDYSDTIASANPVADGLYALVCKRDHEHVSNIRVVKNFDGKNSLNLKYEPGKGYKNDLYVEQLSLTDGEDLNIPIAFTAKKISYSRKSEKDTMSIIFPCDVPLDKVNGDVFKLASFNGKVLSYDMVTDTLRANTPYFIYKKGRDSDDKLKLLISTLYDVTVYPTGDTTEVKCGDATQFGSYGREVYAVGQYDYYGYKGGKFLKAGKTLTMSPCRVAIRLLNRNFKSARLNDELDIVFNGDDNAETITGVEVIDAVSEFGAKVNVYDVAGRALRLNMPIENALDGLRNGIYIVNGKKVVVTDK